MKNVFIFASVITFVLGVNLITNAQNINALDRNNGFQNYKFGMHKDLFPECAKNTIVRNNVEICFIKRYHYINDIIVEQVDLHYIDNLLSRIVVSIKGEPSRKLTSALKSAFGNPTTINKPPEPSVMPDRKFDHTVRIWKGNRVTLTYKSGYTRYGNINPYLIYTVNDFEKKLKEYSNKKYDSSDF